MRFEPDMTEVRAGFPVYDRGDYELKITGAEGFSYMKEPDDGDPYEVAGVQFNFEMVGQLTGTGIEKENLEGEPASSDRFYVHTKGSFPFMKRFVMAAAGYDQDDEELFNEEWAGEHSWFVVGDPQDPEGEVSIGSAYSAIVGNRVHTTANVSQDDSGTKRQEWQNWTPAS